MEKFPRITLDPDVMSRKGMHPEIPSNRWNGCGAGSCRQLGA